MRKSILVIDTPENCAKCPCFLETATDCCGVNGKDIESRNKPDWCPLQDMPERADHPDYCDNGRYDNGWNDCLDQILNGG